jgi:hypothetical protein
MRMKKVWYRVITLRRYYKFQTWRKVMLKRFDHRRTFQGI